jgi:hypothetical protein
MKWGYKMSGWADKIQRAVSQRGSLWTTPKTTRTVDFSNVTVKTLCLMTAKDIHGLPNKHVFQNNRNIQIVLVSDTDEGHSIMGGLAVTECTSPGSLIETLSAESQKERTEGNPGILPACVFVSQNLARKEDYLASLRAQPWLEASNVQSCNFSQHAVGR